MGFVHWLASDRDGPGGDGLLLRDHWASAQRSSEAWVRPPMPGCLIIELLATQKALAIRTWLVLGGLGSLKPGRNGLHSLALWVFGLLALLLLWLVPHGHEVGGHDPTLDEPGPLVQGFDIDGIGIEACASLRQLIGHEVPSDLHGHVVQIGVLAERPLLVCM